MALRAQGVTPGYVAVISQSFFSGPNVVEVLLRFKKSTTWYYTVNSIASGPAIRSHSGRGNCILVHPRSS